MNAAADERDWKPAVCTQCSCLCDDVRVRIDSNRIVDVQNGCPISDAWFPQASDVSSPPQPSVDGRPVSWNDALHAAAELFRGARSPLVTGLNRFCTEGLRAAVELADRVGACIDPDFSESRAAATIALQFAGQSTSTLGEVRQRADVIVFWRADPMTTHPRFIERFITHSERKRTIVVIDTNPTATSPVSDLFLQISPGSDLEILWALRGLLAGKLLAASTVGGIPVSQWSDLVATMRRCHYGALFWGGDLATGTVPHLVLEAAQQLVIDLNAETRFVARGLRPPGTAGAENVLAWQTGFPQSASLARGFPRYSPGEFAARELLQRRAVDLCLFGDESLVADLDDDLLAALSAVPTIVLGSGRQSLPFTPTVRLPVATVGIDSAGTVYRMDEVAMPAPRLIDTGAPEASVILRQIAEFLENR